MYSAQSKILKIWLLNWPTNFQSFEAIGQNKKELEELVAKQALRALQDSNIISSTGKLVFELNTHKTLQTSQNNDEPINQLSVTENEEGSWSSLNSAFIY